MESATYVLLSQQDALERQMAIVSNNVANINTSGYKQRGVSFEDYLMKPNATTTHHMVLDRGSYRNTSQGTLLKTDNPLDIAISGKGYFAVQTPQGTQYTRQGSFQLSADGQLVTPDGYPVLSGGGSAVTIPTEATEIAIGRDGTISTDKGDAGKIQVLAFNDENAMKETQAGFFTATETPTIDEAAVLNQGMIEGSNVKPVVEMTRIIEVSRAYQRVANMISAENDRMKSAIRTLGRVN